MEKKTSIFLIILLCILVAVAGGSLSYVYLNKAHSDEAQALEDQVNNLQSQITKLQKEAKATPSSTPTATITPSATLADPTANWKTYTGTYEGISLKYPSTWKLTLDTKKASDYPGANWQGPFDNFTLTSPNNFKIAYSTHIDGIGGGCDVGVNCPKFHWQDVYNMKNSNYNDLLLVQYESREQNDITVQGRYIALWKPQSASLIPTAGTTYEGALFTFYDGKGADTSLSSLTGSFDGNAKTSLSTTDFFNLPDVKEAVGIFKTVKFSK